MFGRLPSMTMSLKEFDGTAPPLDLLLAVPEEII
jgi:hypothetical protein